MDQAWKTIGRHVAWKVDQDLTVDAVARECGTTKKETRRVLEGMARMGHLRRLKSGVYIRDKQSSLIKPVT